MTKDEHGVTEDATAEAAAAVDVPAAAETEAEALTLEEQLARARAEADEYRDSWLRARAEFANARKRMERERKEIYALAAEDIAAKMLPILDDFERALASVPAAIVEDSWFAGIELVQRKMLAILDGLEIERIAAVGHPFDPHLHEAIMQEEADDQESGTITRELQPGYRRGEKVIRPAMVAVAR